MGIRRVSSTRRSTLSVVAEALPSLVPTILPSLLEAAQVSTQIRANGNYTLSLTDNNKSICGGNGTIYIPTNESVPFQVVSKINIITENQEFIISAANSVATSVFYNSNSVPGIWVVPPKSAITLCKIDTETWTIQGENVIRF